MLLSMMMTESVCVDSFVARNALVARLVFFLEVDQCSRRLEFVIFWVHGSFTR